MCTQPDANLLGMENNMEGKVNKTALISKMKKTWKRDDLSGDFEKEYAEDLKWFFEEFFPDEKSCEKQLRFWLGWMKKQEEATFKCPKCGGTDAKVSLKKEGKCRRKRWVFRCKNTECKSTPSPRSASMMVGSRSPLKFWFLCIYVIGLTNGKVPWAYLNKQRIEFDTGGKKKTIQVRDMSNILYKILDECHSIETRMRYCRLVRVRYEGHKAFKTYSSWYKSQSWMGWRFTFQKRIVSNTLLPRLISSEDYENGALAVCLLKKNNVQEYEWLLVAHVNDQNKITKVSWMYVSAIEKISNQKSKSYKKGYRYLAIQTNDYPIENDQPFIAGAKFKKAFLRSWEEEVDEEFVGSVRIPTMNWLKKVNRFFMEKE